jgi:hypothetical protein
VAHLLPTVSCILFQALFTVRFVWRAAPCLLLSSPVEGLACRLLLQALFTKILHGKLSLPPSPVCSEYPTSSAAYHFQFLFYYSGFFLWRGGQSDQGAMLVYPRGGCGSTVCHLFAHPLVCVSQADLELTSGSTGALLVSQCNMAWRSFVWAGG